jgi:hypothetical protein
MPEVKLFYILSLKHTRGDYILWWGPNRCGYTTDLKNAGLYSEEDAMRINDGLSTMAIPEADVLKVVSRVVMTDHLTTLCKQQMYQTSDGVMTQVELDKETARSKKAAAERKRRVEAGELCEECDCGKGEHHEWCSHYGDDDD